MEEMKELTDSLDIMHAKYREIYLEAIEQAGDLWLITYNEIATKYKLSGDWSVEDDGITGFPSNEEILKLYVDLEIKSVSPFLRTEVELALDRLFWQSFMKNSIHYIAQMQKICEEKAAIPVLVFDAQKWNTRKISSQSLPGYHSNKAYQIYSGNVKRKLADSIVLWDNCQAEQMKNVMLARGQNNESTYLSFSTESDYYEYEWNEEMNPFEHKLRGEIVSKLPVRIEPTIAPYDKPTEIVNTDWHSTWSSSIHTL